MHPKHFVDRLKRVEDKGTRRNWTKLAWQRYRGQMDAIGMLTLQNGQVVRFWLALRLCMKRDVYVYHPTNFSVPHDILFCSRVLSTVDLDVEITLWTMFIFIRTSWFCTHHPSNSRKRWSATHGLDTNANRRPPCWVLRSRVLKIKRRKLKRCV